MTTVRMKSKYKISSISYNGQPYTANDAGVFVVPSEAVNDLLSHGLQVVSDDSVVIGGVDPQPSPAPEAAPAEEANMTLAEAVAKLDADNDSHWTQAGLPDVTAVKEIFGKKTKREDIEAVAPGFTREAALQIKAAALEAANLAE